MVQVQLVVASIVVAILQMLKIQKDHHSPMKFANDTTCFNQAKFYFCVFLELLVFSFDVIELEISNKDENIIWIFKFYFIFPWSYDSKICGI